MAIVKTILFMQLHGQKKGEVMDRIKQNSNEVFRLLPLLLPVQEQHCESFNIRLDEIKSKFSFL